MADETYASARKFNTQKDGAQNIKSFNAVVNDTLKYFQPARWDPTEEEMVPNNAADGQATAFAVPDELAGVDLDAAIGDKKMARFVYGQGTNWDLPCKATANQTNNSLWAVGANAYWEPLADVASSPHTLKARMIKEPGYTSPDIQIRNLELIE